MLFLAAVLMFGMLAGLPVIMASNRKKTPPREQHPIRSYAPKKVDEEIEELR